MEFLSFKVILQFYISQGKYKYRGILSMGSVGFWEPMDFWDQLKEPYWNPHLETEKLIAGTQWFQTAPMKWYWRIELKDKILYLWIRFFYLSKIPWMEFFLSWEILSFSFIHGWKVKDDGHGQSQYLLQ